MKVRKEELKKRLLEKKMMLEGGPKKWEIRTEKKRRQEKQSWKDKERNNRLYIKPRIRDNEEQIKKGSNKTESNRCWMDLLLKHLLIEDLNKI